MFFTRAYLAALTRRNSFFTIHLGLKPEAIQRIPRMGNRFMQQHPPESRIQNEGASQLLTPLTSRDGFLDLRAVPCVCLLCIKLKKEGLLPHTPVKLAQAIITCECQW